MTSKGALEELLYYANLNFERENERKTEFANKIEKMGIAGNEENFKIIEKDLERLEKLEKAIEILKGTKNIEVYFFDNGKRHYRIKFDRTREQEIYQQDYELLKEALENGRNTQ